MVKGKQLGWQAISFWPLWALIVVPIYFASAGAWLIGSQLKYHHDLVDIVLTIIFLLTAILLVWLAYHTARHFFQHKLSHGKLLGLVLLSVLLVPLVSTVVAAVSYVQLNDMPWSYYQANYDAYMAKHRRPVND